MKRWMRGILTGVAAIVLAATAACGSPPPDDDDFGDDFAASDYPYVEQLPTGPVSPGPVVDGQQVYAWYATPDECNNASPDVSICDQVLTEEPAGYDETNLADMNSQMFLWWLIYRGWYASPAYYNTLPVAYQQAHPWDKYIKNVKPVPSKYKTQAANYAARARFSPNTRLDVSPLKPQPPVASGPVSTRGPVATYNPKPPSSGPKVQPPRQDPPKVSGGNNSRPAPGPPPGPRRKR